MLKQNQNYNHLKIRPSRKRTPKPNSTQKVKKEWARLILLQKK